jgi:hypothetical protein
LQNRFSVSRVIIIGVIAELKWESDAWRYRIIHQTESLCLRKWSALPAMSKEEACSFIRFNHKVDLIRLVPVGIYVQVS